MNLGRTIKQYRKAKGLSQAELASILNTSQMTISRLENDVNIWFSPDLITRIVTLLDSSFISGLDDEAKTILFSKDLEKEYYPRAQRWNSIKKDIQSYERKCFSLLKSSLSGADVEMNPEVQVTYRCADIVCRQNDKLWFFSLFMNKQSRFGLMRSLAQGIGLAALEPEINKYTMIWCTDRPSDFELATSFRCFDNLNFDLSVLLYDVGKERFMREVDLCLLKDGRGFFDLSVPEKKEEASVLYAQWKTSLG